jgi:hypothetical protein
VNGKEAAGEDELGVGIGRLKLEPGEREDELVGSGKEVENVGAEPGIVGGSTKLEPGTPDDELVGRGSEVENVGAEPGTLGGSTKLEPCEIGGAGSDTDMDMLDALIEGWGLDLWNLLA